MSELTFTLRAYTPADEAAAIELWRRTWQAHYPHIDFSARVDWWRKRWRNEIVPSATIMVAHDGQPIVGFVTVDPTTGYLDQFVVAPERWGTELAAALVAAAKRISPTRLALHVNQDNVRAIRFYQKHGFVIGDTDVNPHSKAPIYLMTWQAR